MSWYHSSFPVNMIFILVMPASMFDKTTIVLIQILNKLCSFHVLSGNNNLLFREHFSF